MDESKTGIEIKETPENISLDWNDLVFISRQSWGLRHITDVSQATKERKEGFEKGDALAISAIHILLKSPPYTNEKIEKISSLTTDAAILGKLLSEEERQQVVEAYSNAIKEFVFESVGLDINHRLEIGEKLRTLLLKMKTTTAFLIAEMQGTENPSDKRGYFGLGKLGRQGVSPDNVKDMISLDGEWENEFSQEELDKSVDKAIFEKTKKMMTEKYWQALVETIKRKADESSLD